MAIATTRPKEMELLQNAEAHTILKRASSQDPARGQKERILGRGDHRSAGGKRLEVHGHIVARLVATGVRYVRAPHHWYETDNNAQGNDEGSSKTAYPRKGWSENFVYVIEKDLALKAWWEGIQSNFVTGVRRNVVRRPYEG